MRITAKGQVTIPQDIRKKAGLEPNTEVTIDYDGTTVRITRARARKGAGRGARLVDHMRGRGDGTMTTDEIMALTRGE